MKPFEVTHYEVLGLSKELLEEAREPQQLVKRAYHKALLRHHPDKAAGSKASGSVAPGRAADRPLGSRPEVSASAPSFTVDQISTASAVLSDPSRRKDYDGELRSTPSAGAGTAGHAADFQTGIETLDLDDLDQDPTDQDGGVWYRSCRCGNPRGFEFGEEDLDAASDHGELIVGCRDCSLWLKVHFAVLQAEETEHAEVR